MVNIWWKRSTEAELEKAYQRAEGAEGRFPYYGRPLVFQAKMGYFWGSYIPFFLVIETCRKEGGRAGLHYVARKNGFSCGSNLGHGITSSEIISGLTRVLSILNIDRNIFFDSLDDVKADLRDWEGEEKKKEEESEGEKTLRGLEELLNPGGFIKAEEKKKSEEK